MEAIPMVWMEEAESVAVNTLRFRPGKCTNCGMCVNVCPHGVFRRGARRVEMVRGEACMECGACERNCPAVAITVDSGVGCAAAMISAALRGKKDVTCGPECCS